jgi:RNA polymerase-associated protein RTF1
MTEESQANQLTEPVPPKYGDNLIIDSEDEENLDQLPEIERELIMSERYETLQRYKEEKALYDKFTGNSKVEDKKTVGRKRQITSASRLRDDSDNSSSDSSSYSSSSGSGSNSSFSSDSEDEETTVKQIAKATTEEALVESMDVAFDLYLSHKLQIYRDTLLSSFQDVPVDLRNETLHDMLIRFPSSEEGVYLVGRIVEIAERGRSGESGKFDLMVNVAGSENVIVPVSSVSNKEITEDELSKWLSETSPHTVRDLSHKVGKKQSQLRIVKEFVWDDGTINRILSKKNKSSVKITLEIAKLRTSLQAELSALNNSSAIMTEEQRSHIQDNINRISKEIHDLESEYRSTQRAFEEANAHQFGIVAINHRNRTEQRLQDVEEARKRFKNKGEKHAEGGNKELNPFKRRECKPVVMWDVGKRSPKRESAPEPSILVDEVALEKSIAQPKSVLSDLLSFEKLVSNIATAVSVADCRLAAQQRSMVSGFPATVSPVWESQVTSSGGEIMDFNEWKQRVAEDDAMEE